MSGLTYLQSPLLSSSTLVGVMPLKRLSSEEGERERERANPERVLALHVKAGEQRAVHCSKTLNQVSRVSRTLCQSPLLLRKEGTLRALLGKDGKEKRVLFLLGIMAVHTLGRCRRC